jgi:hypothetical protein
MAGFERGRRISTMREMIEIDMDRLKESLIAKSYPINYGLNEVDFGMTNSGFLEIVEELAEIVNTVEVEKQK